MEGRLAALEERVTATEHENALLKAWIKENLGPRLDADNFVRAVEARVATAARAAVAAMPANARGRGAGMVRGATRGGGPRGALPNVPPRGRGRGGGPARGTSTTAATTTRAAAALVGDALSRGGGAPAQTQPEVKKSSKKKKAEEDKEEAPLEAQMAADTAADDDALATAADEKDDLIEFLGLEQDAFFLGLRAGGPKAAEMTTTAATTNATTVVYDVADDDDEAWSDDEAEVASLRIVPTANDALRALETGADGAGGVKRPRRHVRFDASLLSPISRTNSAFLFASAALYVDAAAAAVAAVASGGAGVDGDDDDATRPYEFLARRVRAVAARGGRVLFFPAASAQAAKFRLAIRDVDYLYAVDDDGLGAAQIAHLVLAGVHRAIGVEGRVALPHGVREGFDPWPAEEAETLAERAAFDATAAADTTRTLRYTPAAAADDADTVGARAFVTLFGQPKLPRYGESMARSLKYGVVYTAANRARWRAVEANRAKMREYFDHYYYTPKLGKNDGRAIFVVFGRGTGALSVFLDRLLEANGANLRRVLVLCMPHEHAANDSLALRGALGKLPAGAAPEQASAHVQRKLYHRLTKVFRPHLTHQL